MESYCDVSPDYTCGCGMPGIGLLVMCQADGAFGMVGAIVMMMEGARQDGKEKEADGNRCQTLVHGR